MWVCLFRGSGTLQAHRRSVWDCLFCNGDRGLGPWGVSEEQSSDRASKLASRFPVRFNLVRAVNNQCPESPWGVSEKPYTSHVLCNFNERL